MMYVPHFLVSSSDGGDEDDCGACVEGLSGCDASVVVDVEDGSWDPSSLVFSSGFAVMVSNGNCRFVTTGNSLGGLFPRR